MQSADDAGSIDRPDDDRLRQLLSIEHALQKQVEAARQEASRQILAARAASEQRLEAAREAAARADADQARLERINHDEALAAIDAAHRKALAAIASISDTRVDELARLAIAQVIGRPGTRT